MKTVNWQVEEFTRADGVEIELGLPIGINQWESPTVLTKQVGDKIVLGYLAHDDNPIDPFENFDGFGNIHHHPKSRYGRRDSEYYEALGLDSYGDPEIDWDKAQKLWSDLIESIPQGTFNELLPEGEDPEDFHNYLVKAIAEEEVGDYAVFDQVKHAIDWRFDKYGFKNEEVYRICELVEAHALDWDWDEVRRECQIGALPGVQLLDLYEHSGCHYSLAGGGMQCPWDTSRGIAVWVPDKYALEEIERRAPVYDHAVVIKTNGIAKSKYVLKSDGFTKFSNDYLELWRIAQDIARLRRKAGCARLYNGFEEASAQIAQSAVDLYNQYINGDVWGVVTATYDLDGELISEDSCWGFFGSDYAEEELERTFNEICKGLENGNY